MLIGVSFNDFNGWCLPEEVITVTTVVTTSWRSAMDGRTGINGGHGAGCATEITCDRDVSVMAFLN